MIRLTLCSSRKDLCRHFGDAEKLQELFRRAHIVFNDVRTFEESRVTNALRAAAKLLQEQGSPCSKAASLEPIRYSGHHGSQELRLSSAAFSRRLGRFNDCFCGLNGFALHNLHLLKPSWVLLCRHCFFFLW